MLCRITKTLALFAALTTIAAAQPQRAVRLTGYKRWASAPVRYEEVDRMANLTKDTTWVGSSGNGALNANWSNGLPDDHTLSVDGDKSITNVLFDGSNNTDVTSGLGHRRAHAELTGTANFSNTETVTIDAKVYTFQTSLTDVDGNIQIGADLEASLLNLLNAVNLTGVAGTDYATSMTIHPTCTSIVSGATQYLVAFKNGGTTGNGTTTAETSATASWGGNLADGLDQSISLQNGEVFIDDYSGVLMTPSDPWIASFVGTSLFIVGTPTTRVYVEPKVTNRIVVNGPNYAGLLFLSTSRLAAGAILEIAQGRVELTAATGGAGLPLIIVSDPRAMSENLVLQGVSDSPLAQLIVGPGIVTNNGINITDVFIAAGQFVNKAGTITTLRSTGLVTQETTDTMTAAYIMGGEFDLAVGPGAKTVTDIYLGPLATLFSRRDIDNFILHEIGRK